jgi:hypothetical protein
MAMNLSPTANVSSEIQTEYLILLGQDLASEITFYRRLEKI